MRSSFRLPRCNKLSFLSRRPYSVATTTNTITTSLTTPCNDSISDITSSIFDIAYETPKVIPRSNRHLSKFYQSIKSQDPKLTSKILTDIANDALKRSSTHRDNQDFEFYIDCLKIVFDTYMNFTSLKALNLLRHTIKEYQGIIEKLDDGYNDQSEVEFRMLKAVLHLYSISVNSKQSTIFSIPIMEYFIHILKIFKVNINKFSWKLNDNSELQNCLCQICQFKKIKLKPKKQLQNKDLEPELKLPIDKYLDRYGGISYQGLCDYISKNKFKWKGKEIPEGIFQYFESLPESEKPEFMEEYLKFNKVKQLNIEKYTNGLIQNSRFAKDKYTKLLAFGNAEDEIIHRWISTVTEKASEMMNVEKPASTDEEVLQYFKPFVEIVTLKSMVYYLVESLLGSAKHNRMSLLLMKMRQSYPHVLTKRTTEYRDFKDIAKFINDDSYDQLTDVLLKLVVENCKIIIQPKEFTDLEDALALKEKKMEESFLECNDQFEYKVFAYGKEFNEKTGFWNSVIKRHPIVDLKLQNYLLGTHMHHFPLLHPPKPWTSVRDGGYLRNQTSAIQSKDVFYTKLLKRAGTLGHLDTSFNCLDQMNKTAWVVNPEMLKVFNEVMKYEDGFLDIPPVKPDDNMTVKEKVEHNHFRHNVETLNCVANAFGQNGDLFYHSYLIDFRGRVYPSSILTHYAADYVRSLFLFWESQPLGNRGFYWVKYQLASFFGENDPEKFFEENKENIIEAATNPLDVKNWWMKADKPFSALSVCFEIKKILEFEAAGNNINDYLCRLPIHQDGSCNGLQHYAGLALDELGGKAVNLVAVNDQKQDVYVEVMNLVRCKIEQELASGKLKDNDVEVAKIFLKVLQRKLVKRPIMTTVYGVTLHGAGCQIKDVIHDIVDEHRTNPTKSIYDDQTIETLSHFKIGQAVYLAKKIFESIEELFGNAKKIEKWLVENSKRMLTSYSTKLIDYIQEHNPEAYDNIFRRPVNYTPISWVAPSGFPVIQTYREYKTHNFRCAMGTISQIDSRRISPMDRQKHGMAIAPNFIHSLDAAHMYMTCDAANKIGLTFSAVHDSYWTHPNQVDILSKILREKFVDMYSKNYLESVKKDFEMQMQGNFQLVEYDKRKYKEFHEQVLKLRRSYPERKNTHKLAYELKQMAEQGDQHQIVKLIREYNPTLYHRINSNVYNYEDGSKVVDELRGSKSIPKGGDLFIPVKIMDLPPRGNLDIKKVLDSKYFFS